MLNATFQYAIVAEWDHQIGGECGGWSGHVLAGKMLDQRLPLSPGDAWIHAGVPSPFKVDQSFPNSPPNERLIDKCGPEGHGVSGEQLFKRWIHGFKAFDFQWRLLYLLFHSDELYVALSHWVPLYKKAAEFKTTGG